MYNTVHQRNPRFEYSQRQSSRRSGILRSPSAGDFSAYHSRGSNRRVTFADQVKLHRRNSLPARSHSDLTTEFGFKQYDDRDERRPRNSSTSSSGSSRDRRRVKDDERRRRDKEKERQRKKVQAHARKVEKENQAYVANYRRQTQQYPYPVQGYPQHMYSQMYNPYYAHDLYRQHRSSHRRAH